MKMMAKIKDTFCAGRRGNGGRNYGSGWLQRNSNIKIIFLERFFPTAKFCFVFLLRRLPPSHLHQAQQLNDNNATTVHLHLV
eukprot:scaffold28586_cov107-Skeletonema_dohrnii-CCMP3373.AAC.7